MTKTGSLPLGGDFALGRIEQLAVNVQEVERAVRFYRDTLRLPLLFRAGRMAFFAAGEVRLMLSPAEQPEFNHAGAIVYFAVPDIRAGYQALIERGVHFAAPPERVAVLESGELWMAFFRDSEGNPLALMATQR